MLRSLCIVLCCALLPFAAAKELRIYLLTGQSNSLGAVKGSPAPAAVLKQYEPQKTLYWHENFSQTGGVFPGGSTSWEQVRPAEPKYNNTPCMGPEYGFAFTLEKNRWFPDADIAVIKASRDGGDNEAWQKNGQAYQTLVQAVKNACAQIDRSRYDQIVFCGLLYLQGESNKGASIPKSSKRFLELLRDLSQDLKPYGDVSALTAGSAIIGEHANWGTANETDPATGNITGALDGRDEAYQGKTTHKIMKSLATGKPSLGYVPTRDLPKLTAGDSMGVHYNGRSQITIGSRFAYEAARLAGIDTGSVRNGRYDLPLNSQNAWTNHKLPLKTAGVWNVASSLKPNLVTGTLKLYGISIQDIPLKTVQIQAAKGTADRLILGPGGIRLQAGKNLLTQISLLLEGKQTWQIPAGSTVTLQHIRQQGKPMPTALGGTAEITVSQPELPATHGTGKPAPAPSKLILDRLDIAAGKCTWTLSANTELTLQNMSGKQIPFGKIIVQKGATLNLNGAKLPPGSIVNEGGTVNP